MTTLPTNVKLDLPVRVSLDALRRRIRVYVLADGLCATLATAGVVFWLSVVLDWFFEPVAGVRVVLLLAGIGAIAAVFVNLVVRRLLVPLSDVNMATLLERRFPQLDDTLLTVVSPSGGTGPDDGLDREMLARTAREASRRVRAVRPGDVFNPAPLRQSATMAGLLLASMVFFGLLTSDSLGVWARRNFLLSAERWPRQVRLGIEGFEGGACKVGRGADLAIVATADLRMPRVPKTVEVRYRTESGARGRAAMNREGVAVPGRDPFQQYAYTFQGILSPIEFDLVGGDDRLSGLRIDVVENPKIEWRALRCEYPPYMGRSARIVPVIGPMRIPQGTRVWVEGRANKPLVHVCVDTATEDLSAEPVVLEPASDVAGRRGFRHALGRLEKDVTLLVTLHDIDGIESPEPDRVALAAVADQPPELSVALSGIGTAITPRARVPVAGRVRDDYGLARIWFEYTVDENDPATQVIAAPGGNLTELSVDGAIEVRDLHVAPGQKFGVGVKASDRYDLEAAPHVGSGPRWQLDVVTPEQLRTMLQARELVLRYRFERVLQEVNETRDSLARISFGVDKPPAKKPDNESKSAESKDVAAKKPSSEWAGREPGEEPDDMAENVPAETESREAAVRLLRCERAVQNSRKNGNETLGTAEAFDDLRLQLVNNRIDTEELKIRLKSGIAEPLRAIAEEMFPELEKRLLALREALDDHDVGPDRRDAAQKQVDAILAAMNRVLGRMMELEDFNEAIELLQEIIEQQKKLDEQARQRHKARLRDLLEDN
ncbi:MAG: hypothetical protein JW888_10345 [Pirellulales bacterium]|nr:hypothetical protein [Pirellulales bacterium]